MEIYFDEFYRPRLLNVPTMPSLNISLLVRKSSPTSRRGRSSPSSSPTLAEQPMPDIYEAESPDELALVHAARAYDVKLVKRTPRSAIISLPGKSTVAFEILHVSSTLNQKFHFRYIRVNY